MNYSGCAEFLIEFAQFFTVMEHLTVMNDTSTVSGQKTGNESCRVKNPGNLLRLHNQKPDSTSQGSKVLVQRCFELANGKKAIWVIIPLIWLLTSILGWVTLLAL